MTNSAPLSPCQSEVLEAAISLVNGGLELEDALGHYATISRYVIDTEPPDAFRRKEQERMKRLASCIQEAASKTNA